MAVDELKSESAVDYWADAKNLLTEVEEIEKQRKEILGKLPEMLRKFQGPGRQAANDDTFSPYNFYYEWLSLIRPQIAFQNPKVRVKSKKPEFKTHALAMQFALNRWIHDSHYIRTIERATTHAAFAYGATLTVLDEQQGDYDDPQARPRKIVLDPAQFGIDATARSWEEARIFFHDCVESKADLLERARNEEGWDIKAIESMPTGSDYAAIGRPKADVDRGEVKYWCIWLPGDEPDESETHGELVYLANCSTRETKTPCVLKRGPYYGPRWGPYTIWDFYFVPRSAWPMGPIQVQEGLTVLRDAQAKVNIRRAKNRKDLLLYPQSDQATADAITKAQDMQGVGIPGYEKSKTEIVPFGGVNEDELAYERWLDNLHKRGAGMGDAELAVSGSDASATHDAIAASSSSTRVGFLEAKVYDAVQRDITTVAYFYWKTDSIQVPLGDEFVAEAAKMGMEIPEGGYAEWKGGEVSSFDDLEFEIEPYSMRRQDEQSQQALSLQLFQLMSNIAPLIAQAPWMPWKEMLNKLGDALNYSGLGEGVDYQLAGAIGMAVLQAQIAPPEAGGEQSSSGPPRMSSDVGGKTQGGYGGLSRPQRPAELGKGSGGLPGANSGAKLGAAVKKSA